jgi:hypothetical protein
VWFLCREEIMKTAFFNVAALILAVYAGSGLITNSQTRNSSPTPSKPTADIKIRQRMSMAGGGGTETLLYIKGPRMRSEMPGNLGFTSILQCDLKRTITINEKTKTYMVTPTDGTAGSTTATAGDGGAGAAAMPPNTPPRGGVVNITNTITDTGERKEMFGFTARRIKTSLEKKASPEACDKDEKVETDGWYIDFQYAFECPGQTQKYQPQVRPQQPGCKDEVRTKTIGTAKLGFPVLVTTTIYQPDGRSTSMTQEVLELSREPLSASLFEVPEGYALAKDTNELYGINTTAYASVNPQPNNTATASSATTTNITSGAGSKKPGVIRIGLITPKVQLSAGDVAQATETLRNSFAGHLNGPSVEVVALAARLPSEALAEARQKQCDYMLAISLNIKKGGGGSMFGRAIGNIAGSAAGHIPGGGSATTGAARSAAITGVYTTAAIANSIKARDDVSLEYKLDTVETPNTVLTNTAKAKAKSDGEDVLTPLVQTAAQAILSAVTKR